MIFIPNEVVLLLELTNVGGHVTFNAPISHTYP